MYCYSYYSFVLFSLSKKEVKTFKPIKCFPAETINFYILNWKITSNVLFQKRIWYCLASTKYIYTYWYQYCEYSTRFTRSYSTSRQILSCVWCTKAHVGFVYIDFNVSLLLLDMNPEWNREESGFSVPVGWEKTSKDDPLFDKICFEDEGMETIIWERPIPFYCVNNKRKQCEWKRGLWYYLKNESLLNLCIIFLFCNN